MRISDWSSDVCSSDLGNKADLAKQATFVLGKPNRFHGLAGVDEAWEVLGDGIDAFDNVVLDVALVWHADLLKPLARNHAVRADEAQHSGEHLIGAGPVMTVHDDDFGRPRLADAFIPAQAQHVLGGAMAAPVARDRLYGEERKPSFPAQPLHDVDGRDIDIALRPAVVRLAGEDGRDVPI